MKPNERSEQPAFDSWASYYDLTDADRRPFIDFYSGLLSERTRSVLDLGCGTGTVLIALEQVLLDRGADLTELRLAGVDESPEMLRIARERDPRIEWILGDMRAPPVEGPFDLVVCCFNTLQFLLADEDLLRAFRAVRRLIEPGGEFAFDIYQPNLRYLEEPHTDRLARSVTDERGRQLEIREDTRYGRGSRVLTIDWRLVDRGRSDGGPLARARYLMRQYFPADIDRLLAAAGLTVRDRFGDFDRSPLTRASKKQVLVCGRAHHWDEADSASR